VTQPRELRLAIGDGTDVAAALHSSAVGSATPRPAVLLLPGARGDHAAAHLVAVAEVLAAGGHPVVRAALSSRPPGSGVVGPAERSIGRLRAVLAAARRLVGDSGDGDVGPRAWVVGGASYGGRVASLAVAEQGGAALGVVGLLLVAYPLHPPGRPERLRTAHWPGIDVPVLLLSGDADPFLTEDLLTGPLRTFVAPVTRIIVSGGRHDLAVSARRAADGQRRSPGEAVRAHAAALQDWAAALSAGPLGGEVPGSGADGQ
jgi:predicted alpha/beta-hydrolase family hydrolase